MTQQLTKPCLRGVEFELETEIETVLNGKEGKDSQIISICFTKQMVKMTNTVNHFITTPVHSFDLI